jgi:hypothetical protein
MLSRKTYTHLSGVIFFIVGLMHLLRLVNGWEISIGDWSVPMWGSVLGLLAAWFLAYSALKLSGKKS